MVTAQSGRKAEETHRLSGRSRDQRLVHFSVPDGAETPRPGDLVTVTITEAGSLPPDRGSRVAGGLQPSPFPGR